MGLVLFALAEQARRIDGVAVERPVLDTASFIDDLADTVLAALAA